MTFKQQRLVLSQTLQTSAAGWSGRSGVMRFWDSSSWACVGHLAVCQQGNSAVALERGAGRLQSVPIHLTSVVRGLGDL